ncbi:MAG: serine protease [Geminicoccaceae bacterium]
MLGRLAIVLFNIALALGVTAADARTGKLCNSGPAYNWSSELESIQDATFAVDRSATSPADGGKWEFVGTATLVSDQGYFLTAAHVAAQGPDKLRLRPKTGLFGEQVSYPAQVIGAGRPGFALDDVETDWALLKAKGYKDRGLTPVPLRFFDRDDFPSGRVTGYTESSSLQPNSIAFQPTEVTKDGQIIFLSQIFHGMSGSLLIDEYGRGFAITGAVDPDSLPITTSDEVFFAVRNRAKFAAAPLTPDKALFDEIPPSQIVQGVLGEYFDEKQEATFIRKLERDADPVLMRSGVDTLFMVRNCAKMKISNWGSYEAASLIYALRDAADRNCLSQEVIRDVEKMCGDANYADLARKGFESVLKSQSSDRGDALKKSALMLTDAADSLDEAIERGQLTASQVNRSYLGNLYLDGGRAWLAAGAANKADYTGEMASSLAAAERYDASAARVSELAQQASIQNGDFGDAAKWTLNWAQILEEQGIKDAQAKSRLKTDWAYLRAGIPESELTSLPLSSALERCKTGGCVALLGARENSAFSGLSANRVQF